MSSSEEPMPEGCIDGTVKVASLQSPSSLGEIATNVARFERQIRTAAAAGAKVMVLPETAITGYLSEDLQTNWKIEGRPLDSRFSKTADPVAFAEPQDGPSVTHFSSLAAELGVYITVPFIEIDQSTGHLFNAVSLVGPRGGKAVAHYRKNCPWPDPEKSWATPFSGVENAICDTEYGRVGLAICFDIHSILAKYHELSLWALLYPIAWVGDTNRWFNELLPLKLQQCACPHYIVGANWATMAPPAWAGAGGSTVYGPHGKIVSSAGTHWKETIVYATLPTQGQSNVGNLDLDAYQQWTKSQRGTDYWHKGNDGPYSFASDMKRLHHDQPPDHSTDESGLHKAERPWRPQRQMRAVVEEAVEA
mmetsp:Transcript_114220/g.277299  ORF Transcript_114220/g.277299 Transcript_114220/m.277299 type:complete len:363 (+) Transcript_114220:32-1120(+)